MLVETEKEVSDEGAYRGEVQRLQDGPNGPEVVVGATKPVQSLVAIDVFTDPLPPWGQA